MVEFILSRRPTRLPEGSRNDRVRGIFGARARVRIGSKLFFCPETFAVKCTREIAMRLLSVAERFCSNVVPEIQAAIEQEKQ